MRLLEPHFQIPKRTTLFVLPLYLAVSSTPCNAGGCRARRLKRVIALKANPIPFYRKDTLFKQALTEQVVPVEFEGRTISKRPEESFKTTNPSSVNMPLGVGARSAAMVDGGANTIANIGAHYRLEESVAKRG